MADAVAEAGEATIAASAEAPPQEPAEAKAKKPSKEAKGKKDAGKDKGKGKGKGKSPDAPAGGPSIAGHQRAVRSIALTKSWCGLVGFLIAGYLSLPTSTLVGVGLRAVAAGTVCYVAGWGAAVFLWRRLVMLEIKAREQQLMSEALARHAAPAAPGASGGPDAP